MVFDEYLAELTINGEPITDPVTKLGGQPVWLDSPQWPISSKTGEQMQFLAQFAIPGSDRMAYLFMTDADTDGTWETEAGENALIIQPGGRIPHFLSLSASSSGPTMSDDVAVSLVAMDPAKKPGFDTKIGGKPVWLQSEESPAEGDWDFLFQIDNYGPGFTVDFGDSGVGYGFISRDKMEGRFLWQCY